MAEILYLIRHGITQGGEEKRYKGSIDVPLSHEGIEQMKRVREYIRSDVTLDAIYTSPLTRAVMSAKIIAEPDGPDPVVIHELMERNFGIWEGMSFNEIVERYPQEFNAWRENPLIYSPPQGESTMEVARRVKEALDKILNNSCDGSIKRPSKIAIVAHGGVNRIILAHFLGLPLENIFRIGQDYGAINIIEFNDGYPVIKLMNKRVS